MTINGWLQIAIYFAVLTALVVPLGRFMARVFEGERTFLSPVLRPVEAALYRIGGVDETREQHWITYTVAMLFFNAAGFPGRLCLLRLQAVLPLNPADQSAVAAGPLLQHGGQLHHQHQLAELRRRKHDELSDADGWASPRRTSCRPRPASRWRSRWSAALRARRRKTVGNFWVDLTRCTLYVLLPLSHRRRAVSGLAGRAAEPRRLCRCDHARGRQADAEPGPGRLADRHQAARHQRRRLLERQLGGALREPDPLSNFVQSAVHPADLGGADAHVRPHGRRTSGRAGRSTPPCRSSSSPASSSATGPKPPATPNFAALGLDPANMEGKEVRFGIANSSLWAVATTAASNGSVNSMHDSFTPLGGMMPHGHDPARRDHLRRRRLGPLRHAALSSSSPCSWPA